MASPMNLQVHHSYSKAAACRVSSTVSQAPCGSACIGGARVAADAACVSCSTSDAALLAML
jgi:hypothetical protein